jgi:hypothetical protein
VDILRSTIRWQIAPTAHYDTSAGLSHGQTSFRDLRHRALSAAPSLSRKARRALGVLLPSAYVADSILRILVFLDDRLHFLDSLGSMQKDR